MEILLLIKGKGIGAGKFFFNNYSLSYNLNVFNIGICKTKKINFYTVYC